MSMIVGLTGGIGSGKSTVSAQLAALNVPVIDTDQIAHELTQANGIAIAAIVEKFGIDSLDSRGAMNRPAMREKIYNDAQAKLALEQILHPLILQQVHQAISHLDSAPWLILAVPLLSVTSPYLPFMHRVLVVDCSAAQQVERTMTRSKLKEHMIHAIMAQQIDRQQRLSLATEIIRNEGSMTELSAQINACYLNYQNIASTSLLMSEYTR